MSKGKLKFDLTNNSTSEPLLAEGVFSSAILESGTINTFEQILNAKDKVKLGIHNFGDVLQSASCSPTDTGAGTLAEKEIDVEAIDVYFTLCQRTLEQSFLSSRLAAGSNRDDLGLPADFQAYIGEALAKKISADLEVISAQGDTTSGVYPTNLTDGLEKELINDATVVDVVGTAITPTNVIDEMTKVYDAIDGRLAYQNDLAIYVSSNVARAYRQALANASSEAFYNQKDLKMNFLGVEVIEYFGMSDNKMMAGQKSNFALAADLMSDFNDVMIIPQLSTTGKHQIVVSGGFKFKTSYAVGADIVYYSVVV